MLGTLIQALIAAFGTNIGAKIGNTVANGAAIAALIAAIAPFLPWLSKNKDVVFLSVSYGDLTFWGLILLVLVKIVHYSRPGSPVNRGQGASWPRAPRNQIPTDDDV